MAFGLDDLFSAGASFLGSAFQASQQQSFLNQQQSFQQEMSNTAYQRAVKDMQAAGLNPASLYGGHAGPASTPGGGNVPNVENPGAKAVESATAASAIKVNSAQAALLEANAAKAIAEKAEIEERTRNYEPQRGELASRTALQQSTALLQATTGDQMRAAIDKMHQEIEESKARINNLAAQTTHQYASAGQALQQTENLRAQLPHITAAIEQLRSLTRLNDQQTRLYAEQTGKTVAEVQHLQQQIRANLPELQRQVQTLEVKARHLDMPRRGMEAAANDSYIGALGAVLRTINPLSGLIGATK